VDDLTFQKILDLTWLDLNVREAQRGQASSSGDLKSKLACRPTKVRVEPWPRFSNAETSETGVVCVDAGCVLHRMQSTGLLGSCRGNTRHRHCITTSSEVGSTWRLPKDKSAATRPHPGGIWYAVTPLTPLFVTAIHLVLIISTCLIRLAAAGAHTHQSLTLSSTKLLHVNATHDMSTNFCRGSHA
jgi:hypothetical protein